VMSVLCAVVIMGIWLEHLLLLGPALNHHATTLPLGLADGLIFVGFFGLIVMTVMFFLNLFPEFIRVADTEVS
ncbi:hypothetical protein ACFL0O_11930, partial [Thermodesulfobacteriota bacterium]